LISRIQEALTVIVAILLFVTPCTAKIYYVSADRGNDSNIGSRKLPFRTISKAASKVRASDKVLIYQGVYREVIQIPRSGTDYSHTISFKAAPRAYVEIKGSDIVTNWTPHSGAIWKRTGWDINSQQVFVDGLSLQQIGKNSPFHSQMYSGKPILPTIGEDLSSIFAGSFWYDGNSKILYVWLLDSSDPNKHQVEASVRDSVIPYNEKLNFIALHNLHFAHSNQTALGQSGGIVNVAGRGWAVSGNTFMYGDSSGLHIGGEGHRITKNVCNYNGNSGITMNGSEEAYGWKNYSPRNHQDIVLEGNETSYNNYRNFNFNWEGGGIKVVTSCNGVTISSHKAQMNYGHGIWIDGFCQNIFINRCIVSGNAGAGIFYEISDKGIISNNLVLKNYQQGIYVSASNDVAVYNNTVVGNGYGIVLHGMPREEHPTLQDNKVKNNIIAESQSGADLVVYSKLPVTGGNMVDYNLYIRRDGKPRISWTNNTGYAINYIDLVSFNKASGLEEHSLISNSVITVLSLEIYELVPRSPAIDSGTNNVSGVGSKDLAGNDRIADGNGKARGVIDIGAYEFQKSPKVGP
jgi:parallel beta-helix repeat protein